MSEYSPLPWQAYEADPLCIHDALGCYVAEVQLDENDPGAHAIVDLIVRACNSHADLLEALKEMRATVWGSEYERAAAIIKAEAAIAKAEGR